MKKTREIFFYLANIFIGILGFYTYLYFWVSFSWGEKMKLISIETLLSLSLSSAIFLAINYLFLRKEKEKKKYWWISSSITVATILIIVLIIELS